MKGTMTLSIKKQLITPYEVQMALDEAGWNDINRSTITRWCNTGKLKGQKWEGKWFINRTHFEETVLKPMMEVMQKVVE